MSDFCIKCGTKNIGNNFCTKCGQQSNSNPQTYKRSSAWYLLPIIFGLAGGIFGIVGGLIAYFILKNSDPKKGKNCLIIGLIFTIIGIIFGVVAMDSLYSEIPSLENDWVEEYWAQYPDEDPCNDPTAKAFGLCN